ncbi:MAG: tetratricopeptide repeat protein [Flavobacterium sp. JAD_PAG50586_2]|nr:MAG: tetratricopeptide repeat protein [Flavobacterium sp. JAD_PAG50586_2]
MIQKRHVVILLLMVHCAYSQRSSNSRLDTLSDKSFDYLHNRFGNSINDPAKSTIYATALLLNAKEEKVNFNHLALAYKACIINADKSVRLFYADSMITNAKKANSNELIGSCYLTKGIIHYRQMEHIKALDNYLIADRYISQMDNPALAHKTKYEIGKIKYYLGFYDEAIALFRECVAFFKEENDRAYLNSMHMLGLSYVRIGKYDLATATNNLAIEEGRLFEETGMEFYFEHSEGINQCFKENYTVAIKKLNAALPEIIQLKDYANEAIAYFYIGKSHWSLKQRDKAVAYFKKVDLIFKREEYILPDLRKGYEYLIDYYKERKNTDLQLYYISQLLKVDKILAQDYKYLLKKLSRNMIRRNLSMPKKILRIRC